MTFNAVLPHFSPEGGGESNDCFPKLAKNATAPLVLILLLRLFGSGDPPTTQVESLLDGKRASCRALPMPATSPLRRNSST
jgi:hypothetical protein